MKFVRKNLANGMASAVLLMVFSQIFVGCNKQKDAEIIDPTKGTRISVSISGIEEKSTVVKESKSSSSRNHANEGIKIANYGDFDASTSIDQDLPSGPNDRRIKSSTQRSSSGLKAAVMPPGIKYRLFLFNSDGSFDSSHALESGVSNSINVGLGKTYNWYAVSYNSAEEVADIAPNDPLITLSSGKDVLYAAGQFVVPETPNANVPLTITFKRKVSRIAVEMNSMGMFGNMSNATVSVSGLSVKAGSLNLLTGKWVNLTNSTQTIDWSSFEDVDPQFQDRKIAYAYTVDSSASNNVVVAVSNLGITHADGNSRTFSATPTNFTFTGIQAGIGMSQRLLLNLIESPLTVTQGGTTVRWARSNLYYVPGHNPYRFYGLNSGTTVTDGKGYFSFGGIIPRKFATKGSEGDPCALVYPEGVWRQPTNIEFAPLTTGNGLLTNILGSITDILFSNPAPNATGNGSYIQYPVAAGGGNIGFTAASNVLRFYYNGEVTDVNVLTDFGPDGLVNLNLGASYGREAALWTNVSGMGLLGLGGLGAWGYHAANKNSLSGPFIGAQGTAELLSDVTLLEINVVSSTFKNVRCVRN